MRMRTSARGADHARSRSAVRLRRSHCSFLAKLDNGRRSPRREVISHHTPGDRHRVVRRATGRRPAETVRQAKENVNSDRRHYWRCGRSPLAAGGVLDHRTASGCTIGIGPLLPGGLRRGPMHPWIACERTPSRARRRAPICCARKSPTGPIRSCGRPTSSSPRPKPRFVSRSID